MNTVEDGFGNSGTTLACALLSRAAGTANAVISESRTTNRRKAAGPERNDLLIPGIVILRRICCSLAEKRTLVLVCAAPDDAGTTHARQPILLRNVDRILTEPLKAERKFG